MHASLVGHRPKYPTSSSTPLGIQGNSMAKAQKQKQKTHKPLAIQTKPLTKKKIASKADKRKSLKNVDELAVLSLDFQHDDLMHAMTKNEGVYVGGCVDAMRINEEKQAQFENDARNLDETLQLFRNLK